MSTELQAQQVSGLVPAGTWQVDPSHSAVEFAVRHMMISTVKGRFIEFEGTLENNGAGPKAYGTVKVNSVDTHEAKRDEHLRSPDFLDAASHPEISFESKRIEQIGDAEYRVVGDITIRGVTREIELQAETLGAGADPWGGERVGIEARGELNRKDFGLTYNQALETGGVLVGEKVKISVDIEAVKAGA